MPVWIILIVTALYLAGLFWLAWKRDKKAAKPGFRQSPIIYALAIGVYCTSWTYFGAVGTAASSGWDYLPIYIGPILVFALMPGLIRRIANIARREGVTSLSDFLSARYGKSQSVATLATIAAVTGSLPYIALQLKSVGMSFVALSQSVPLDHASRPADETVLLMALILAVFAILFGARQSDKTRQNAGLMQVLALEALLKLGGLIAVCLLSLSLLGQESVSVSAEARAVFEPGTPSGRFITMTLLSMGAIICLPRQFHVTMIERRGSGELRTAQWLFPLYLIATSLVVVPIAMVGMSALPANSPADLYVLNLPMSQGDGILALIVFLGGFSAAMGMVIVSSVALSTMVTNDLIVPALLKSGRFASLAGDSGARLLTIRRGVILILMLLAYGYYRAAGGSEALAQIGLLSFAAAIQFAPALIGGIYWKEGRRAGAVAGLVLGMGAWAYTLFLPALIGHAVMASALPVWLNPHALFGASFGDSLTHGVVWSLALNLIGYVTGSLRARERLRDRVQAAAFTNRGDTQPGLGRTAAIPASQVTPDGLRTLAERFLDANAVQAAFEQFEKETGARVDLSAPADWRLVQLTERMLARALGASSARVVMASAVGGLDVALPDVLSILDTRTRAERFDRH
ncbi:MAG: sodium:solute symporter, partial [Hyphomonadaceae bacterium]|nr:sodium:solute symporter [Hyphomonadaceae bacterium]